MTATTTEPPLTLKVALARPASRMTEVWRIPFRDGDRKIIDDSVDEYLAEREFRPDLAGTCDTCAYQSVANCQAISGKSCTQR